MGCTVVFVILFEPFLSLQIIENSNNTRVLFSAVGAGSSLCYVVSLCPGLCLSLKDIPESRGPPDPTSRVP